MQRLLPTLLAALAALVAPSLGASRAAARSGEKLQVVTTIPDLADIVRRVGGDEVEVKAIARGFENLHTVRLRPSHMVMVSRAKLFVQVGLALEHGWVPGLLESARNSRIMADGPLNVAEDWPYLIEVPLTLDRSTGVDIHPLGNPHVNLDPRFGAFAAQRIRDRLKELRPEAAAAIDANCAAYEKEIEQRAQRWKRVAALVKGRKVVQYHKEFSYLCLANGLEMVGALEPQPGVPPTPRHLAQLAKQMRAEGVQVVVHGPWTPGRIAEDAAARGGARAVELPVMAQRDNGETWLDFMDRLHDGLLAAWDLELPSEEEDSSR